jgi:hypothetical protein
VRDAITFLLHRCDFTITLEHPDFKKLYWYGIYDENYISSRNLVILLFFDIFRFIVFKTRRRGDLDPEKTIDEMLYFIRCCKISSKSLTNSFNQEPFLTRFLQATG